MTTAIEMTEPAAAIEEMVRRGGALYSLPGVAVEVLKLTDQPKVNVRALKECIERDPALTVKILRVVNSSLFGLPREVSDLNQALALLGIKPLKLLALGFSLPESLFAAAAREQLDWYWKTTLVRAVAAREISEQLFQRPGDDAFLAGLLQDLGVLVLLGQLRQPYAALLGDAIATQADLSELERGALGFDHVQLTAGLLEHWNLPPLLVKAIAEPRDARRWARNKAEHAHLVRVLHLAEMFAQLIGQRRLSVLPDLLETGGAYCNLDKPRLNELIGTLEPKVRQLANVLSPQVADVQDYTQIIVQAHEQMSRVAELVAATLSQSLANQSGGPIESESHEAHALALARQLRTSFEEFFDRDGEERELAPAPRLTLGAALIATEEETLSTRLTLEVGRCRSLRQPLGVVLLAVEGRELCTAAQSETIERFLDVACRDAEARWEDSPPHGNGCRLLILSGSDRSEAVATAKRAVDQLRRLLTPLHRAEQLPECIAAAGVAWAATPAKNFRAMDLVDAAERCLGAALKSGGVKSLEVS